MHWTRCAWRRFHEASEGRRGLAAQMVAYLAVINGALLLFWGVVFGLAGLTLAEALVLIVVVHLGAMALGTAVTFFLHGLDRVSLRLTGRRDSLLWILVLLIQLGLPLLGLIFYYLYH